MVDYLANAMIREQPDGTWIWLWEMADGAAVMGTADTADQAEEVLAATSSCLWRSTCDEPSARLGGPPNSTTKIVVVVVLVLAISPSLEIFFAPLLPILIVILRDIAKCNGCCDAEP